jgi:hypothetical protein
MVRLLSRRRSQIILIEYSHKGAAEQPIPQYVQDYVYQQWEHLKKLEAHGEALNREIESLRFQLQVQTVAFANQYPTLCGSVPAHMQADRAAFPNEHAQVFAQQQAAHAAHHQQAAQFAQQQAQALAQQQQHGNIITQTHSHGAYYHYPGPVI